MSEQRVIDAAKRLIRRRNGEDAVSVWCAFLTKTPITVVTHRIARMAEVVETSYLPQAITEDRAIVSDAWMREHAAELQLEA